MCILPRTMKVIRRCLAWTQRYGWKKLSTLVGIAFVNLPAGIWLYYGNLLTYVTSYLKLRVGEDPTKLSPNIFSSTAVCWALGLLTAKKSGSCLPRPVKLAMGYVLLDLALFSCYFSVQHSGLWTTVALGAMAGLATGQSRAVSYEYFLDWFSDKNTGLLDSIVSNTAPGAMLYNCLITNYVNPENFAPELKERELTYFEQDQILDRVPSLFVVLAGFSFLCHTVGLTMIYQYRPAKTQGDSQIEQVERMTLLDPDSDEEEAESSEQEVCEYDRISGEVGAAQTFLDSSTIRDSKNESHPSDHEDAYEISICSTHNQGNADGDNNQDPSCTEGSQALNGEQELEEPLMGSETDSETPTSQSSHRKLTLLQAVRTKEFGIIWLISGLALLNLNTVSLAYKPLGQIYIKDDHFLLFIASATMVVFLPARILWGVCFDLCTLKTSFVLSQGSCCFFFSVWYFQPMVSPWLYLVGTCLCTAAMSGPLALVPLGLYRVMGTDHFSTLYGLASTAGLTFSLLFPTIVSVCLEYGSWFGVFIFVGGLNFLSLVLVLCFFPQGNRIKKC